MQMNSKDFSMGNFETQENVGKTTGERGKFSTTLNAQSNETSAEKHSLQRCHPLTHDDQKDTASVLGVSELLQPTEESQAQNSKHDLEIPPQANITSIPLSSFPSKMQQLMSARAKDVPEVRKATEIPTVTYIWPVIKTEEASSPFWAYFPKSLIPKSPNITRHCSNSDVGIENLNCSQITPEKQLTHEALDRKTRLYSLIVKSSNSVVSEILKSLNNIENKDYKRILPLSSTSPVGEQLKIPLFKESSLAIYNGQVYLLYVMRHKVLSPEMELYGHDMLLRMPTACLIVCTAIREVPVLSNQYVVKQTINYLRTLATTLHQDKTSNVTQFSSHRVTTVPQSKQCSPSTGKRHQTALSSKEGLQNRNEKEARLEKGNELRMKCGIVKDLRVHLNRISLPELMEDLGKTYAH
ncbi:ligand-dependent nuclear receptor-interacting factor 1-like isoform X2 [Heliangelus exortis]|uniref:ligand-dependent nuclear receptor-interacting factor 1-like isoform X2 n=1 Tax=Heliangelus exortis TaxID=472823 RepID=UPI003A92B838